MNLADWVLLLLAVLLLVALITGWFALISWIVLWIEDRYDRKKER